MSFNAFYNAIAGQESGGNYSAVNGRTGALGAYQILPSNVGPWSKQYLGYYVSPQQFLKSPALQDKLARAVLQDYYNKYGARGAASAWYSGSPKNHNNYRKFNPNEPSIGEYVDQVLGRIGDVPEGPTVGQLPAGKTTTNTVDNRTAQTPVQDLLGDKSLTGRWTGLEGVDRTAPGLEAATGGVGLSAASAEGGLGLGAQTGPEAVTEAPSPSDGPAAAQSALEMSQPVSGGGSDGLRGAMVDIAKQFVGTPYVWGGAAPGGFDCSGLIQYAMKQVGIDFPRVSWDQINMGKRVGLEKLKPGDLVGFGDGGHIAVWLGGGQVLEAPRSGLKVRIRDIGTNPKGAYGISLDNIYR